MHVTNCRKQYNVTMLMLYYKSLNVNYQYFILSTLVNYLCLLFSAKLQLIEYSATIPKFPELTGNFGESGRRLGVER